MCRGILSGRLGGASDGLPRQSPVSWIAMQLPMAAGLPIGRRRLSGMQIDRPALAVGNCIGHVVRRFPHGFAVMFADKQNRVQILRLIVLTGSSTESCANTETIYKPM